MNLKEIAQPSDQKLLEEIQQQDTAGFAPEDLVKVIRAKTGNWTTMSPEEAMQQIRDL